MIGEGISSQPSHSSRWNEPVPGPSSEPETTPPSRSNTDAPLDDEQSSESDESDEDSEEPEHDSELAKLVQEGGVRFMNFLLGKAVPPYNELLNSPNHRDWTLHDIAHLPVVQQKKWKTACNEELEALHKQKIFELCDSAPQRP